nr:unnamed protein product [Digitaria exilis]
MVMLVYLVIKNLKTRRKSTCNNTTPPLPPGPTPWPVVGNIPEMLLSDKPAFRWIHHVMKEMGTDIACVKLGGVHVVCPSRHTWLHGKRSGEADNLTRYVYNLTAGAGEETSGVINIRHVARHYCGNVVRRLVFNMRYFGEPQPDGGPGLTEVQHVDAVFACMGLLYSFHVSDYLPWLLGLDLDGHEKMVKEANETVHEQAARHVRRRAVEAMEERGEE